MELQGYSCPNCSKVYTEKTYSSYKLHIEKCGSQKFTCEECGNSYLTLDILKSHMKKAHSEFSPFICKTCGKEFSEKFRMKEHEQIHLGAAERTRLSCEHCDRTFGWKGSLRRHQQDHFSSSLKVYTCPCGQSFHKYTAFYTHKKYKCPAADNMSKVKPKIQPVVVEETVEETEVSKGGHKCQFCMAGFSDRQLLADHIDTCDPFMNTSQKALTKETMNQMVSKYKMKVKANVHEEDKADKDNRSKSEQLGTVTKESDKNAENNDNRFGRPKRKRKIKEFIDYETDLNCKVAKENPDTTATDCRASSITPSFFCPFCKFGNSVISKMRDHLRDSHGSEASRLEAEGTGGASSESKDVIASCGACVAEFENKDGLLSHILMHHAPEPYLCGVCQVPHGHTSMAALRKHMRVHTVSPFDCNFCRESFPDMKSLQAHNKRLHSREPNMVTNKAVAPKLERKTKALSTENTDAADNTDTTKTDEDTEVEQCDNGPETNNKSMPTVKQSSNCQTTESEDSTEIHESGHGRSKRKRKIKQFTDYETEFENKVIQDNNMSELAPEDDASRYGRSKRKTKVKQFTDYDTDFCITPKKKSNAVSQVAKPSTKLTKQCVTGSRVKSPNAKVDCRNSRKNNKAISSLGKSVDNNNSGNESAISVKSEHKVSNEAVATSGTTQTVNVAEEMLNDTGVNETTVRNTVEASSTDDLKTLTVTPAEETSKLDVSLAAVTVNNTGVTEPTIRDAFGARSTDDLRALTVTPAEATSNLVKTSDTGATEATEKDTFEASSTDDLVPESGETVGKTGSSHLEKHGALEEDGNKETDDCGVQSYLPEENGKGTENSDDIKDEFLEGDDNEKRQSDTEIGNDADLHDDDNDDDDDDDEGDKIAKNTRPRKSFINFAYKFPNLAYVCTSDNCYDTFVNQKKLIAHKKAAHGEKFEHECEECGKTFTTIYVYKSHLRMKHFNLSFVKLAYRNTQLRHANKDLLEQFELFVCVKCGGIHALSGIREHTCRSTVQMRFFCPYCTCSEKTFTQIQRHIKESHPGEASSMSHGHKYETLRSAGLDEALLTLDETSTACTKCDETFTSNTQLLEHVSKAHVNQPFCCGVCRLSYGRKTALKKHLTMHGDLDYKCADCPAQFSSQKELDAHRNIHTGDRPYICEVCNNRYCYESSVRKHMLQRHPDAFREKYGDSRALQPASTESEGCVCPSCGQMFKTPQLLNRHMNTHNKETVLQCPDCSRYFETTRQYNNHQKFRKSCQMALKRIELCSQKVRVNSAADIRRAMMDYKIVDESHSSGRPYQCGVCRKRFRIVKTLYQHMQTMHMEDRVKSYICSVCGRGFPRRSMLDIHYRIHTSARPYRCRLCHKSYRQLGHIREHLRAHGKKLYACKLCGKSFKTLASFSQHIMRHCDIFPFKCPVESCTQTFADVIQLCQHGTKCFPKAASAHGDQPMSFLCKFCNNTFKRSEDVISHLSSHENEGMFTCTVCNDKQTSFKQLYFHKDKQGHFLESELERNIEPKFTKYVNKTKASRTLAEVDWQYGIEDLMSQYDIVKESSLEPSGSDTVGETHGVTSTGLQVELPEEGVVEETYGNEAEELILIAEQLTNMATGTEPYTEDIVMQEHRETPQPGLQPGLHGLQTEYDESGQVLVHIQNSASENLGYSTVILEGVDAYEGGLQVVEGSEEFVVKSEGEAAVPVSYGQEDVNARVLDITHSSESLNAGTESLSVGTTVVDIGGRSVALNTTVVEIAGQNEPLNATVVDIAGHGETLIAESQQEDIIEMGQHPHVDIPVDIQHGEDVKIHVTSEQQETLSIPVCSEYVETVNSQIISSKQQPNEHDTIYPKHNSTSKENVSETTAEICDSMNEQAGHEVYVTTDCQTTTQALIQIGEVEQSNENALNETRTTGEETVPPMPEGNKNLVKQDDPNKEIFEDCHVDIVKDEKIEMSEILDSLNLDSFDAAENAGSQNNIKVVDTQGNEMSVCVVNERGEQEPVKDSRDILRSVLQTGRYKVQCRFKQVTTTPSQDNTVATAEEGGGLMIDMGDSGTQEVRNSSNIHITDVYVVIEKDASENIENVKQKVKKPQPVAKNAKKGVVKDEQNTRKIKGELVKHEDFIPDFKDGFNYKVCLKYYEEKNEISHPFLCECGKRFARVKDLNHHKKYHKADSEKKHRCSICGKGFVMPNSLTVHMRSHTGAKPYTCPTCDKTFRQRGHLQVHLRTHNKYLPFKCSICQRSFLTNSHLTKHITKHDPDAAKHVNIYNCDICSATFPQKRDLKLHKFKDHLNKNIQEALLKRCNALEVKTEAGSEDVSSEPAPVFTSKVTHLEENNKKHRHICDVCGQRFSSDSGLKLHRDRHNKESNFSCNECDDKSYSTIALLKEHRRVGHQDKLPCEICGVLFKSRSSLRTHLLRVHNKGAHKYECQSCGEKFILQHTFMRHVNWCMKEVIEEGLAGNIVA